MLARFRLILAMIVAAGLALVPLQFSQAHQPGHDRYPNAVPSANTPSVLNGEVLDIVQVGGTIVTGGSFSSVGSPGGSPVTRNNVFAFNATTGQLNSSFAPAVNGVVEAVLPGPTSGTVYIAGSFTQVNSTNASHVALLNVSNGQLVTGFRAAATNGKIFAIEKVGNRLFLGGNFTTAGGAAHRGLATLNAETGALDPYMNLQTTGRHNDSGSGAQGAMGVRDLAITHAGDRLVAIGNFKQVNGLVRDQIVLVNLTPGGAEIDTNWRTRRYEPYCFNWAFDSYIRSVSIAPDDSYFVVATTGGHNNGTLCDTVARWNFSDTGQDVREAWFSDSGGDTLWATAVTEKAVFVGGHQRWMNNNNGSDFAGPGAVPRAGLAALDPKSGVPIAWNPGRNPRGAAVYALYPTETGLWLGSDTEYIGNRQYRRPRIAFFPLAGGLQEPSDVQQQLPGTVYLAGKRSVDQGNVLYRVNAGGGTVSAIDGGPDWAADDTDPSPVRNGGSNAAGWDPGATRDGSLPAHAPTSLFDTERWSPSDNPRMSWAFPVAAGRQIQVRLFFANRYDGTSAPGQRVFHVDLEGNRVLNNFDIAATVGHGRGMMRTYDITSDGTVNIDFSHVVENPLINAIEIVDRNLAPPSGGGSTLSTVEFNGTTAGQAQGANALGVDWGQVRGSFLIGNTLYYGWSNGQFYKRTFTPAGVGPAELIDPYHDPIWDNASSGSGGTFRGNTSAFYGQITNVTGLIYRNGRIYYTLNNDSNLYWRGFNVDSGIVGTLVSTANGGMNWSNTSGLFTSGDSLYVVNKSTGALSRVSFAGGVPQGPMTTVDTTNDWRARGIFIGQGVAPNQEPTARFEVGCVQLECTVDGTTSSDPDGDTLSYAWDFGDGSSGSGATPSHTYEETGEYTITLTVSDGRGGSHSASRVVNVVEGQPSSISFVASTSSNANTATPQVTVPQQVQGGDQLVLFGSGDDLGVPPGWTLVDSRSANGMESHVWTRRATASDAGSAVTVPTTFGKTVLALAVYRGVDAASPVAVAESNTAAGGTEHVAPTVNAPQNAWVLQFWSNKSSSVTEMSVPATVTTREVSIGSASGRKSAVLADSGGGVAVGQSGGVTATTDASSGRAINWTVALRATAGGGGVSNQEPSADFEVACIQLECSADGTTSSDPDGDTLTYAWDFGDGSSGSGATPSHEYDEAGEYTITLTVSDGRGGSDSTSRVVNVVEGQPSSISFVASTSSNANTATPQVTIPQQVQGGDQLLLFGSGDDLGVPAGWALVDSRSANGMESHVWTRRATASDAGSAVTVPTTFGKTVLALAAYRGVDAASPVVVAESSTTAGGTEHATPTVNAPQNAWVLQFWSNKSSSVTEMSVPATVTTREVNIGAGSGRKSAVLADSGGGVAAGQAGGATATTDTSSGRAINWTLALRAAS